MYYNKKIYEIKYSEVDAYDILKPSALLGFLQESAGLSADELGFGYGVTIKDGIGFILANWYVEMNRAVKQGEKLEVRTWPVKPKHVQFLRDFEFLVDGERVGAASSRWCMINVNDFSIVPINSYFSQGFFDGYRTDRSVEFNSWKIGRIVGGISSHKRRVCPSDIDHFFHLNNTKYADILLDSFSVDETRGKFVNKFQITYVKQCKEGETVEVVREDGDGYSVIEGRVGEELRAQLKVQFNEV